MTFCKLIINNVSTTKGVFNTKFKVKGFDVILNEGDMINFRLFLSNNELELVAIKNGNSKEGGSPFFIDFKRDPQSNGFYIPESRKVCPKLDYYLLLSLDNCVIEKADFFFEAA